MSNLLILILNFLNNTKMSAFYFTKFLLVIRYYNTSLYYFIDRFSALSYPQANEHSKLSLMYNKIRI